MIKLFSKTFLSYLFDTSYEHQYIVVNPASSITLSVNLWLINPCAWPKSLWKTLVIFMPSWTKVWEVMQGHCFLSTRRHLIGHNFDHILTWKISMLIHQGKNNNVNILLKSDKKNCQAPLQLQPTPTST